MDTEYLTAGSFLKENHVLSYFKFLHGIINHCQHLLPPHPSSSPLLHHTPHPPLFTHTKGDSPLPVNVEGSHNLREGEVLCNGAGHAHLINLQVGVGRDDCTGREVHPLPHQVPSHSPLLALQPLLDRLQWPSTTLDSLWSIQGHMTIT